MRYSHALPGRDSWPAGARLTVFDCLNTDFISEMRSDIGAGLSLPQKLVPCKYLYDEQGSRLFDEICTLPEYYPTRAEMRLLDACAPDIMSFFRYEGGDLIELGSGSDLKIRKLLDALHHKTLDSVRYVPVDISRTGLLNSARSLVQDYDRLRVHIVFADFTRPLYPSFKGRKLIAFLGGTIGNFPDLPCNSLLRNISRLMGPDDLLVVGMDMLKDIEVIEAAYNDGQGVTSRFNLNVLNHINRMLGADFRLEDFRHLAFFNPVFEQIEMHVEAVRDTQAHIRDIGLSVRLAKSETIHTEISRKFSRQGAERLFYGAGLRIHRWYTDQESGYSLVSLRTALRTGAGCQAS